ncbi:TRAP transporter substrate-binding protein DctP [Desulfobacula phenolica]|uniref:TRAP-type C4-dicarboxylate transport system, substrate-binding protein n=1 Tax=Desulfobacula phenolica TaxID=90732 RepID=A0A1H2GH57_9BACT|nr:TRAP transporter substrate-binding protein DctP [Desulfobacula phenolica]SDU18751.1 TRAP-type C4-dicarboxylate transport system, substrate-binding protein [Desulfobacula phenolica]
MNWGKSHFNVHRNMAIALIIGTLILFFAPSAMAKKITLRYASYNPPRGMGAQTAIWMMDEITKRSKEDVNFQQYFGGTLIKARETLRGIQRGTADMGYLFVPYFPKELQTWTVAEPFVQGPVSPARRGSFFWELYDHSPEMEKQLKQWNQKVVAIRVFGMHSVGGSKPIKSLIDLKKQRVRCAGGYDALHMGDFGAKIVFLKGSEVYSAMQKGAVDANYTPLTSYYKYRLYEIGKNPHLLLIPQFVGSIGLVTINLDTWNNLSADLKKIISEVGREYSRIQDEKIRELEKEYIENMKTNGCNIFQVSKEEIKNWAEVTQGPSKIKWITSAREQGVSGAEQLLERTENLIRKYTE